MPRKSNAHVNENESSRDPEALDGLKQSGDLRQSFVGVSPGGTPGAKIAPSSDFYDAVFSNWRTNPELPDELFEFQPSENFTKVQFENKTK